MSTAYTGSKSPLKFWQIWNMCFGFFGIQFGWSLQMANMSAIFEQLGAQNVAGLWLAAPLTGLIVQPIIGYLSDRTWHPFWGRRKPYFIVGALLSSTVLLIMPNSSSLWMAAGLLWVLDASINVSMEPFRAYVADNLPDSQRPMGFTMQSFFIGIGSVLASMLPFILTNFFNVADESGENGIPTSVKWSFYIGAGAFLFAVLYSVLRSREYPPDTSQRSDSGTTYEKTQKDPGILHAFLHMPKMMKALAPVQFFTWIGLFCMWIFFGVTISRTVFGYHEPKQEKFVFSAVQIFSSNYLDQADGYTNDEREKAKKSIRKYLKNPGTAYPAADLKGVTLDSLFRHGLIQFDTSQSKDFISLANLIKSDTSINSTPSAFLNSYSQKAPENGAGLTALVDAYRVNEKNYRDGIEWGGTCFSFYSLITFLVAFLLPILAKRTSLRHAHAIALTLGGVGLISTYFIQNQYLLLFSMAGVGVAWASTVSLPYAMLSGSLPPQRMGVYMGIFNFFIVIPEIISALSFDWILDHVLHNNMALFLACGGVLMVVASIFCLRIKNIENE